MNDRDELVAIIDPDDEIGLFTAGRQEIADAVLAAGYRKPRMIDQVDELLDLPACTVVREHGYGRIWEKTDFEGTSGDEWNLMGDDCSFRSWALVLPITVLYVPESRP